MHGWQVVTAYDEKIGHVVAEVDDYLIVEQGHVIKSRHPLPKVFATPREDEREICITLPKDMVHDSPKVDGDNEFDREAAARHYGLAEAMPDAPTEGYGEVDPSDPGRTAEQDALAAGRLPGEVERARIRGHRGHDRAPSSPALLGERKRDFGKD
jgi:hypothetical protein